MLTSVWRGILFISLFCLNPSLGTAVGVTIPLVTLDCTDEFSVAPSFAVTLWSTLGKRREMFVFRNDVSSVRISGSMSTSWISLKWLHDISWRPRLSMQAASFRKRTRCWAALSPFFLPERGWLFRRSSDPTWLAFKDVSMPATTKFPAEGSFECLHALSLAVRGLQRSLGDGFPQLKCSRGAPAISQRAEASSCVRHVAVLCLFRVAFVMWMALPARISLLFFFFPR